MSRQYRPGMPEESSDESDDDYVPPEQVEVEDAGSDSAGADLEPSSGGDTDLDIGRRKRKRKVRPRNSRTKKKQRVDDTSDNNDETTSNETLLSLPVRPSGASIFTVSRSDSKSRDQSSTPSPSETGGTAGGLSESEPTKSSPSFRSLLASSSVSVTASQSSPTADDSKNSTPTVVAKPTSGLGSMLAKLSGKKKTTTLEKSQMDWKQFKDAAQIEDELTQHNKGKAGYLDRKDFLERSNIREYQFSQNSRPSSSRHD